MPPFNFMLQDHNKTIASNTFHSPFDFITSPQSNQEIPQDSSRQERHAFKHHPRYHIQTQPLLATQLWQLRQEQIQSTKQKLNEYRENQGQFQKELGKGGRRTHPAWHTRSQLPHKTGSEMSGLRATSCGTGVFLPRGTAGAQSESRTRPGKGCSTVLIPARVVQALQLQFDQISATSGSKSGAFPPLQDVLVSDRDGMYSLQKRQLREKPAHIQKEMVLPQEWTY